MAGPGSLRVLALLIALMAVLTSQHPASQRTLPSATDAAGVGAARIGPSLLDSGSERLATEGEHAVDVIGDSSSRVPMASGALGALASHSPPAGLQQYVALQPRTGLPLTGRSALVNAPKTSPPAARS